MSERKYIYTFEEGDAGDKMLLGGKGANLCAMTQIGLNVPPGFVITTAACLAYLERTAAARRPDGRRPRAHRRTRAQDRQGLRRRRPTRCSSRCARARRCRCPGMMDTILNLGLNADDAAGPDPRRPAIRASPTTPGGASSSSSARSRWACPTRRSTHAMAAVKRKHGAVQDVDLDADALQELAQALPRRLPRAHRRAASRPIPTSSSSCSIEAVFRSWNGKRAVDYRRQFRITTEMANGTAVNVCTMVFGNMGDDSATGVGFTRNPGTGENVIYGEYLVNAQGEDVVAGIRTPKPIAAMAQEMPEIYRQLVALRDKLEAHYQEVQDFEFTIERGRLYCLQTRNGKMNARAMVITSVEMFGEGLITKERALTRINADAARAAAGAAARPGARGRGRWRRGCRPRPARPPAASCSTPTRRSSAASAAKGDPRARGDQAGGHPRLLRGAGHPDQPRRQDLARGGGRARHGQALRLRLRRDRDRRPRAHARRSAETMLHEGDVDHHRRHHRQRLRRARSRRWRPSSSTSWPRCSPGPTTWRGSRCMANADTPRDAARARQYGAMGIGLCRTERMFNDPQRLPIVQEMILAETREERRAALDRLLPIQRADFKGIFKAMAGLPVTVRLLDPPMHEFLPTASQLEFEIAHLRHLQRADALGGRAAGHAEAARPGAAARLRRQPGQAAGEPRAVPRGESRRRRARAARGDAAEGARAVGGEPDARPSRRAARASAIPEIYEMQIRAILEAAAECCKEGVDVHPEIMVPQVVHGRGAQARQGAWSTRCRPRSRRATACSCTVKFGTMIEVVRACMRAARARRGRRVLLVRHQRPHAGDVLVLARGCREQVPAAVHRDRHPARQPVRGARRQGRGPADAAGRRLGPRRAARPRRSASAASTAGSRSRSASATTSGSTTSRARRRACRSRGSRRRRRR